LFVRPFIPSDRRTPLLQVCCCGPGWQEISIDCCTAGVMRLANAGSATLSAYVVAEHSLITIDVMQLPCLVFHTSFRFYFFSFILFSHFLVRAVD